MPLVSVSAGQAGVPSQINQFINLLTGLLADQGVLLLSRFFLKSRGWGPGAPTLTVGAGGSVDIGSHTYYITLADADGGETLVGTGAAAATTTGNQTVNITAVPTGPTGTTARKIYRSKVGGTQGFLLTTLNDNTTTSYTDITADASLGAGTPPVHPSFGGSLTIQDANGNTNAQIFSDGAITSTVGLAGLGWAPGKIAVFDNGGGTLRFIQLFEGATDPTTYATVNEGDWWLKG